jgi:hypothetical protein
LVRFHLRVRNARSTPAKCSSQEPLTAAFLFSSRTPETFPDGPSRGSHNRVAMDAVLKADYGDKDQKAKNDADAARVSAAGAGVRT